MCARHMGNTLQELASNIILHKVNIMYIMLVQGLASNVMLYNVNIVYIMPVQGLAGNIILYNVNIMCIMHAVDTKSFHSCPTL